MSFTYFFSSEMFIFAFELFLMDSKLLRKIKFLRSELKYHKFYVLTFSVEFLFFFFVCFKLRIMQGLHSSFMFLSGKFALFYEFIIIFLLRYEQFQHDFSLTVRKMVVRSIHLLHHNLYHARVHLYFFSLIFSVCKRFSILWIDFFSFAS